MVAGGWVQIYNLDKTAPRPVKYLGGSPSAVEAGGLCNGAGNAAEVVGLPLPQCEESCKPMEKQHDVNIPGERSLRQVRRIYRVGRAEFIAVWPMLVIAGIWIMVIYGIIVYESLYQLPDAGTGKSEGKENARYA